MMLRAFRAAIGAQALTALMAAATLAGAGPRPAAAQIGATLQSVQVVGNQRIEAETVRSYLALQPGETITAEALNRSVRRLFDTGLFSDAAVDVRGDAIVVRVEENPSINRVVFEGNDVLTDEELLAAVAARPRRAFTRSLAEGDAQTLIDLYRRTGRYGAAIEPQIIELPENRVDLVYEIREGDVTEVEAINFVGNDVYSDRRLRRVIETSEAGLFSFLISSDIYDPDRLEFDRELLRQFYLSRGYADFSVLSATAELSPERDGFFITFVVDEGPQYDLGEQAVTTTAPGLDPAAFEALLEGEPGDTYDADLVEENIDRLVFEAGQRGFAFVEVRPRAVRNEEALTIDIVYELVEGPRVYVERIDIEGNTRTLDRVIRRQFGVVEGDAFNSREIDRARRRIRGLGYFSTTAVDVEPGSTPDRTVVRVRVEEQPTGSLTFGIGYSTAEGPVGEVSLTERNFLGRGQLVRAQAVIAGDTQTVDLAFREPALLDRDLEAGFDAYYRLDDRTDESSFEETNFGFVPTISFPVSENGRLSLDYRISQDTIRDVDDDASPFIKRDEGDALTSEIGYTYLYDRRNDPLEPTGGYVLRFGQDFAGLGGDTRYVKTTGSARAFTSVFAEDVVASLTLEAGHIQSLGEEVRITDRFFLGGDRFRGFAFGGLGPRDPDTDDALGGEAYTVLRAETSFPIGLPEEFGIYGGVFSDVGTLWRLEDPTEDGVTIDDDPKLRASVGASLFIDSGFGPIRLNVATPVVRAEGDEAEIFRLTAGTRF